VPYAGFVGDMRISYAKFLQLLERHRIKRLIIYGDMRTAIVEVGKVCCVIGMLFWFKCGLRLLERQRIMWLIIFGDMRTASVEVCCCVVLVQSSMLLLFQQWE
jgi:hypothetical protein